MDRGPEQQEPESLGFRDWFALGCIAGTLVAFLRNPVGASCLFGCLLLLVVLTGVGIVAVLFPYRDWLLAAAFIAIIFWYVVRPRLRG